MKLQSLSNFALNNNEMDATKGGKRFDVKLPPSMQKTLSTAKSTVTYCPLTGTTMAKSTDGTNKDICIEWKNGVATPVVG
jgi:hypothetical protein